MFVLPSFYPGGAERVTMSLANWINDKKECNVSFISFHDNDNKYLLNNNINVVVEKNNGKNRISCFIKRIIFLRKIIKEINPNIIFSLFERSTLLCLLCNIKRIALISSERVNVNYKKKINRIISKYTAKKCDGYIFQTQGAKIDYPMSVQKKSIVIPNAISNSLVYEKRKYTKNKIISAMGRLTYQKAFDVLIKAFSKVHSKHSEYCLEIFGEGVDRDDLQKLINSLGLESCVRLLGNDLNAINKIADSQIFVLSSRYEGMPNALIEAMAVGTACISTDCNYGPKEVIKNNFNGLLIPTNNVEEMANAINYLIENEKNRKIIEKNSVKIKNDLDADSIFLKYYNYFQNIYLSKNDK